MQIWTAKCDLNKDKSSRPEVFCKKVFREISQNSQENTCASLFFNKAAGLRPIFIEHLWKTASVRTKFRWFKF